MSKIYLKSEDPRHFLIDSKGDMYEVSEELADVHAAIHPKATVTVDRIDKETKTIWFASPLPDEVKAER